MIPRMKERYRDEVLPSLLKEFQHRNVMEVARVQKVTVNIGLGEAIQNGKALDAASAGHRDDHRSEAGHHPGQEVDRQLQSCGRACPSAP